LDGLRTALFGSSGSYHVADSRLTAEFLRPESIGSGALLSHMLITVLANGSAPNPLDFLDSTRELLFNGQSRIDIEYHCDIAQ